MGIRVKTLFLAILAIVIILVVAFLGNIFIFCRNTSQVDLKFFKIDCGTVPNKPMQLDTAFSNACNIFSTTYNCDLNSLDSVTQPYAEFGRQQRNYTLMELCKLKNDYVTNLGCAALCGCKMMP